MDLDQILALLGVANAAEGVALITNLNAALGRVKAATGKSDALEALAELQARADRAPFALAVEKACGKQGDEALGLVHAALASHAALPAAQARVAELEKTTDQQAFDTLVAKAKAENKLTPAQETAAREAYGKGELMLKSAEFFFANLATVAALRDPPAPPAPTQEGDLPAAATFDGKTYAEMSAPERAALAQSNPDLFKQMRASYKPAR